MQAGEAADEPLLSPPSTVLPSALPDHKAAVNAGSDRTQRSVVYAKHAAPTNALWNRRVCRSDRHPVHSPERHPCHR
ncbi:MAG: hypothetical protein KatS3mg055_3548 [Chloroflexus sp.]|nr:MAG: hypothetical protein KatS3mg055_3548 [Chloroflexus sp.]